MCIPSSSSSWTLPPQRRARSWPHRLTSRRRITPRWCRRHYAAILPACTGVVARGPRPIARRKPAWTPPQTPPGGHSLARARARRLPGRDSSSPRAPHSGMTTPWTAAGPHSKTAPLARSNAVWIAPCMARRRAPGMPPMGDTAHGAATQRTRSGGIARRMRILTCSTSATISTIFARISRSGSSA